MKVKTWKTTMAALMGLFILAGCGNGTTEDSSAADGSAESDAFVVGMEAGYPPFNWTQNDDSNGAVVMALTVTQMAMMFRWPKSGGRLRQRIGHRQNRMGWSGSSIGFI